MHYFKCHWCGGKFTHHETKCINCGAPLSRLMLTDQPKANNSNDSIKELIKYVSKIKRILVLILLMLIVIAGYYGYSKNIHERTSNTTIVNSVAISPSVEATNYRPKSNQPSLTPNPLSQAKPVYNTYIEKQKNSCELTIDEKKAYEIYLVTSYEGIQKSKLQFGISGHEVKETQVVVNKPFQNVVLVLMAYDPVIWKVRKTVGTNILGVILAGYHEQVLYGIASDIPVLEANYEKKTACKYFYESVKSDGNKFYVIQRIQQILDKEPNDFIVNPESNVFYIGNSKLNNILENYPDDDPDLAIKKRIENTGEQVDGVLSTEDGIRQLLNGGKIRLATSADIENWSRVAYEHQNNPRHRMILGMTYVVLDNIQLPRGMYGAHLGFFIIEKNVPVPSGGRGHSFIYLLKDGSCLGFGCIQS